MRTSRHRQRGVTLVVVLVAVLLSALLVLWASRTTLFSEMVVGNDADYQRTFQAVQAMLRDAELDIRGERANGFACVSDPDNAKICRTGIAEQIPLQMQDVVRLVASNLAAQPTRCRHGLCARRAGAPDFWNDKAAGSATGFTAMTTAGIGAQYGEFTGATLTATGNLPIDNSTEGKIHAWYWIEVLPYLSSGGNSGAITNIPTNLLSLNPVLSVVYRITALAQGLKPGTTVVLQEIYAQAKIKD